MTMTSTGKPLGPICILSCAALFGGATYLLASTFTTAQQLGRMPSFDELPAVELVRSIPQRFQPDTASL